MIEWELPVWGNVVVFVFATVVVGLSGVKTAALADRFADRTGLGEAVTGSVFIGLITAIPGLAASVTAAAEGHAALAISNALGGVAAQTAALAIADISYTRANLEHAAASVPNMMQAILLIAMLTMTLLGMSAPEVTWGHVHPGSIVLFVVAGLSFWLVYRTTERPMWRPKRTRETVPDVPAPGHQAERLRILVPGLLLAAGVTGASGVVIAEAAENIVEATPIPEVVVGGLFMAFSTSLPEVVTSVAAVRRGALTLAVSDVVGGNFFDVLFIAAADFFFLGGSVYHAEGVGMREIFLGGLTILLNVVLLAGLIYREERGPIRIGFESVGLIVIYLAGFLVLALGFG